jgi:hypothetical protein
MMISSSPVLPDPLESHWVEVRESTIPGAHQGLFLTRDAKKGDIVAFFNGLRWDSNTYKSQCSEN